MINPKNEAELYMQSVFPTSNGKEVEFKTEIKRKDTSIISETACYNDGDGNISCFFPFYPVKQKKWLVKLNTESSTKGTYGCNSNMNGDYRCWKMMQEYTSPTLAVYNWMGDIIVNTIGSIDSNRSLAILDVQNIVFEVKEDNETIQEGASRVVDKIDDEELAILVIVHNNRRVTNISRQVIAAYPHARCISVKTRCANDYDKLCIIKSETEKKKCSIRNATGIVDHALCSADDSVILALAFHIGKTQNTKSTRIVTKDKDLLETTAWFLQSGWTTDSMNFKCANVASLHVQQFLEGVNFCSRSIGKTNEDDTENSCHTFQTPSN